MKKNRKTLISVVALAAVCMLLGAVCTQTLTATAETATTAATTTVVVTSPFTAAIDEVAGSVVGISNYKTVRYSNWGYDRYGRGNGYTEEEQLYATGSGVVIAEGGYVLTNYHVVEGASSLKVTVGEEAYEATMMAYDSSLDIAVLQASSLNLPAVKLGDSDTLRVGDWAICIGNPVNESFNGTVTAGIISGLDRSISTTSYDRYGRRETTTNSMIQTDAAINSGNSGGGMFSVTGELMGIPTMKYSGSLYSGTTVDGIGLCIPINTAKPLIEEVLNGVTTSTTTTDGVTTPTTTTETTTGSTNTDLLGKPRMGITVQTASAAFPTLTYNGTLPSGAYIAEVEAGSPAEAAGLQAGDIVVEANGTLITASSDLTAIVSGLSVGDSIELTYYRVSDLSNWNGGALTEEGTYATTTVTLAVIDLVKQ